jgi:hypothetical protein
MELPGEMYLFNLSILAITFSAVSALVTLLRHSMGGKLSNFDVFLVTNYAAHGFVLAIAAIMPSLLAEFGLPLGSVWAIASGLAAIFLAVKVANTMQRWKTIAKASMPYALGISFGAQWIAVLLLIANILVGTLRGAALFELALTLGLATVMWSFVRRISTLVGDKPSEDWDPKRG